MTYRAIYAYAWDIAEIGVPEFVGETKAVGLNTVSFAGAYHAGKFIRPKGRSGKVYFPEDGTVYFRPDLSRYARIQPLQNSLVGSRDVLDELCRERSIATNAWMVLLHNTRLGSLHPDATVENAFGDRYVYSLCPSHPAVREYAVALCKDVSDNYPVCGLSLESPGFLPYQHGYHHEFALMRQNRWFDAQMGLCFCEHCLTGASKAGIDAAVLKKRIAKRIEAWLDTDFDIPDDMADAFWLADVTTDHALSAFLQLRCDVVTSLVAEIRDAVRADATVAVIPSVARPTGGAWYEGTEIQALAAKPGIVEACFYEPSAARIRADILDVRRRMDGAGTLRGILRPGHPDLQSQGDVTAAVLVLLDAGIEDIAFYNYGHLRRSGMRWIGAALSAAGG